jgi:putative CocE/NonD family hydrolase
MIWPDGNLLVKAIVTWGLMAHRDPTLGLGSFVRGKLQDKKLDAALGEAPLVSSYRALSDEPIPFLEEWLKHPTNDDGWWDGSEVGSALDAISCPVLVQGGWYDLFLDDSLMQYQRLAARGVAVELKLGPWTHGDMLTKGLASTLTDATAWLRDQAGLEPRDPATKPVRLVEINSRADLALDGWPDGAPAEATYHLATGGRLTADADAAGGTTSFRYDPADPTPRVGGASNDDASGAKDNSRLESRADVVTFTSEPLAAETHLLGVPVVDLTFASDRSDTAVFVRLCEVTAEGKSINVTDRLVPLRADDRASDGTWQLEVALPATCISIAAGHRIRLQLSSGAFPRFARHPGTSEPVSTATDYVAAAQAVHHASSLRLPLSTEPAARSASASTVSA